MQKHGDNNFLLVSSDFIKNDIIAALDESNLNYTRGVFFKTVATDLSKIKINSFDILVFYSPRDIDSLYKNYPDFKQENTKIAVFGDSTYQAAIDAGLNVDIQAPTKKSPSMSMALNDYLSH